MKSLISASRKNLLVSLALSILVSALVGAAWAAGVLASVGAVFMLGAGAENVPPQPWVAWVLIVAAGAGAGFAAGRAGARRALKLVAASLFALAVVSLLASLLLRLDTLFAPMMLAGLGSLAAVQARRLWVIDAALSRGVGRAASASALEGGAARARLEGGLKLLDAVLALEEATVFRVVEDGALAPAARLRSSATDANNNAAASRADDRNNAWREGVALSARAVASGELILHEGAAENGASSRAAVALPLKHEGRAVGALLVRLRGAFEESDRPLLLSVCAFLRRARPSSRRRPRGSGSKPSASRAAC